MCRNDTLRRALLEAGFTCQEASKRILLGTASFSQKLNYQQPWTLDEVYGILDLLGVGPAAIPALFPDRPCRPSRRCAQ